MLSTRGTAAVQEPIYVLARSLPPSRFKPGNSSARVWTLIASGVFFVAIAGFVVTPRVISRCTFGCSKLDVAKLTVKKYALEAYPEFLAANPTRTCPIDLHELDPWMNLERPIDPYGTPYTMACASSMIIVGSAGEDATFGTPDDIWSNQ